MASSSSSLGIYVEPIMARLVLNLCFTSTNVHCHTLSLLPSTQIRCCCEKNFLRANQDWYLPGYNRTRCAQLVRNCCKASETLKRPEKAAVFLVQLTKGLPRATKGSKKVTLERITFEYRHG